MIKHFCFKYKKQIIICCLFTFLFTPFSKVGNVNASTSDIALNSQGLNPVLLSGAMTAMGGILVSVGLLSMSPFIYNKLEDYYTNNPEVFDGAVAIGQSLDGKIAVSSGFINRFLAYIREQIGLYPTGTSVTGVSLSISPTSAFLYNGINVSKFFPDENGIVYYVPVGSALVPSGNYLYNNKYGYSTPSKLVFEYKLKGNYGANQFQVEGQNFPCFYESYNSNGITLFQKQYSADWYGLSTETSNPESVCVDDTLYKEEDGDLILDVPTDTSKDYYAPGVGLPSIGQDIGQFAPGHIGVLNPDGTVSDIPNTGTDTDTGTDTGTGTDTDIGSKLLDKLMEFLKTLFAPLTLLLEKIMDLIQTIVNYFNPDFQMPELPNIYPSYDITELFNFDRLWNVQPTKPRWKIQGFWSGLNHNMSSDDVDVYLFDIPQIEENINIIRNFTTYPLLISVMWFIIKHFAPRRTYE